ncbi:hypothetical protein DX914_09530 [Lysobacter silvisoli]|uniref:Uncharacterized protein n=1 Tax=Lysobacter silvisoli TaxID=2293254 RepID=A0A371K5T4_9GAMM|nr:hypothetical protein DX914_09530 [Lysobacter silvisoli]
MPFSAPSSSAARILSRCAGSLSMACTFRPAALSASPCGASPALALPSDRMLPRLCEGPEMKARTVPAGRPASGLPPSVRVALSCSGSPMPALAWLTS